jgi:predicted RNA binding protein YcfA (HicA-like mRNA interferase family)
MGKYMRLRETILEGSSDNNIDFSDLCQFLARLGFDERVKGSHHIFTRNDIPEIINLQPRGSKAKPYQVRQIRGLIVKHQLGAKDVD